MTPIALTIAGSDCSAGAGLQADLKTFHHFGCHGLTVVTCVVAETSDEVRSIHAVPSDMLRDQLELMMDRYPVGAVKTGMLFSKDHVLATADVLSRHPDTALVIDPVMIASTGDPLVEDDAISAYRDALLPRATLVTPNLDEAAVLAGRELHSETDLEAAAPALAQRYGASFLLKGGHLAGDECADLLWHEGRPQWFRSPRLTGTATHGTGCTLSAAIAAGLARGRSLPDAVAAAKCFLTDALRNSLQLGDLKALNHGL